MPCYLIQCRVIIIIIQSCSLPCFLGLCTCILPWSLSVLGYMYVVKLKGCVEKKKPLMTSDKLLNSPSNFPFICLWNKRRTWHYMKSHDLIPCTPSIKKWALSQSLALDMSWKSLQRCNIYFSLFTRLILTAVQYIFIDQHLLGK